MPLIASAASGAGNGSLPLLFPALLLALLAYLIFAQRRRGRREAALQAQLQVGDEVMTRAGFYGRIAAIRGGIVDIDVAPGVSVKFDRRAVIPAVLPPIDDAEDPSGTDTSSTDTDRE